MKLWRIRSGLYRLGRVLGDVQAVERGPKAVERRVLRRTLGRLFEKILRRIAV
jgi:hypothetical protein